MNTKRTGRKALQEDEKVKQKKVYLSDKEEKRILKKHKKQSLTEVLKAH